MAVPRSSRAVPCLRLLAAIALALVTLPSSAMGAAQARTSSIGSLAVSSSREAPWSALLSMREGEDFSACSGSIVDATHVLTAAHCTYDRQGSLRPASAYTVLAGIADSAKDSGERQLRAVSAVRVEPSFVPGEMGADVALLRISPPFDLSDPGVKAIEPADDDAGLAVGGTATLFGWGQVEDGRVDGKLHRLDQGLLEQWQCAHGVPSLLCAWSATGAACAGDSGGGLVTATDPPRLLGVSNFVVYPSSPCAAGNLTAYTDVTTPEIRTWLSGEEEPPLAPRASANALLWGEPFSRGTAICNAPKWDGDPALTTTFLYTTPGSPATQVVQRGPSNKYELGPEDVGHSLVCVSVATNAGGTTQSASWRPIVVGGRATELIEVRQASHDGRRWQVRLAAAPSLRGERLKARWTTTAGCGSCPGPRSIAIERRTRLISPPLPSGGKARLTLRLPALSVGEIPYRGATLRVRFGVRAVDENRSARRIRRRPLGLSRGRQAPPLLRDVGQVRRASLLAGAEGAR